MAGFPWAVPLDFVFDENAGPFVELPEGEIERIASHCEDGKSLLIDQFRGRPRIEALLCALLERVQEVDDTAWRVLTERTLDNAIGVQLDGLGEIVGQPRRGFDDATFRVLIRARIAANRSDGATEAVYAVITTALETEQGATGVVELRRYGTAFFLLTLAASVGFDETVIGELVQAAKSAGVRAVTVVPMAPAAEVLRFTDAATFPNYTTTAGLDSAATPDTGTGKLSRAMDETT